MSDFIRDHFDKLLVSFFLLLFAGVCLFFAVKGIDGKAMDWAAGAFETFLGLLGGLISGIAIGKSMKPSAPPQQ